MEEEATPPPKARSRGRPRKNATTTAQSKATSGRKKARLSSGSAGPSDSADNALFGM